MSNEVFAGLGIAALVKQKMWVIPALIGMTASRDTDEPTSGFLRDIGSTVIALLIVGAVTGGIAGTISSYQTKEVVESMTERIDRLNADVSELEKRMRRMGRDMAENNP